MGFKARKKLPKLDYSKKTRDLAQQALDALEERKGEDIDEWAAQLAEDVCKIVKIELIRGVEGYALCINDYRVAGPKPWGGGTVEYTWQANIDHILEGLKE